MKKFDITFRGEVLPKHDPERVKAGFIELFKIRDSGMLEEIFSGEPVVLRSNLDRKAAAEYFVKVNQLGAVSELGTAKARFNDQDTGSAHSADDEDLTPHPLNETQKSYSDNDDILVRQPGLVDRIWPVSAARMKRPQQRARQQQERATRAQEQAEAEARRLAEIDARRAAEERRARKRKEGGGRARERGGRDDQ